MIQQNARALFVAQISAIAVADHSPVHVRNDVVEWDIILAHHFCRELRCAVNGLGNVVVPVYTHFDADGRPVSRTFIIGMLARLCRRQALVYGMIVHSEMPCEKTSAVVPTPKPIMHGTRIMHSVGAAGSVVCGMNRDVGRVHRPMQGPSAFPWRNDVLHDLKLGGTGAGQATNGGERLTKQGAKSHWI